MDNAGYSSKTLLRPAGQFNVSLRKRLNVAMRCAVFIARVEYDNDLRAAASFSPRSSEVGEELLDINRDKPVAFVVSEDFVGRRQGGEIC
jgi:hypothetical protein